MYFGILPRPFLACLNGRHPKEDFEFSHHTPSNHITFTTIHGYIDTTTSVYTKPHTETQTGQQAPKPCAWSASTSSCCACYMHLPESILSPPVSLLRPKNIHAPLHPHPRTHLYAHLQERSTTAQTQEHCHPLCSLHPAGSLTIPSFSTPLHTPTHTPHTQAHPHRPLYTKEKECLLAVVS